MLALVTQALRACLQWWQRARRSSALTSTGPGIRDTDGPLPLLVVLLLHVLVPLFDVFSRTVAPNSVKRAEAARALAVAVRKAMHLLTMSPLLVPVRRLGEEALLLRALACVQGAEEK